MSVKVAAYVWKHAKHRGTTKLLLLALADFANDSGICWPSAATLSEYIGETERHTRRLIEQLVKDGDLIISPGGGRGKTTRYGIAVGMSAGQRNKLNSVLQNTVSKNSDISETVTSGDINSDIWGIETVTSGDKIKTLFGAPESAKVAQNGGGIHHGSVIDPPEIADRAKSATATAPSKKKKPVEETQEERACLNRKKAIEDAYVSELGYTPPAFGKEAKSAKWLAEQGYTPDQVVKCYRHLREDDFYAKQHVSLITISKQIGAFLKLKTKSNGHGTGPPIASRPNIAPDVLTTEERAEMARKYRNGMAIRTTTE